MTRIDVENPQAEERLLAFASSHGMGVAGVVEKLALEYLPAVTELNESGGSIVDRANDPLIDLMNSILAEVPTDPDQLRKNDAELAEFIANLNANRLISGEDPLIA